MNKSTIEEDKVILGVEDILDMPNYYVEAEHKIVIFLKDDALDSSPDDPIIIAIGEFVNGEIKPLSEEKKKLALELGLIIAPSTIKSAHK